MKLIKNQLRLDAGNILKNHITEKMWFMVWSEIVPKLRLDIADVVWAAIYTKRIDK